MALPELDYLARIGGVAYTVSSLEWTVLGDLNRVTDDLPDTLTLDDMEPAMSAGIASGLKAATAAMEDGPTKDYLVAAYRALFDASVAFWIDDDWLDAAITKREELRKAADGLRRAIG